jgi:type IV pilus assembly protein PilQ
MMIRKKALHSFLILLMTFMVSCTGLNQQEGGDELPGEEVAAEDSVPEEGGADDFSEFADENSSAAPSTQESQNESTSAQTDEGLLAQATADQQQQNQANATNNESPPTDEFQEFEKQTTDVTAVTEEPAPPVAEPVTQVIQPAPESPVSEMPPQTQSAKISSVLYKANEAGGTLVIEADRPITFQTRINTDTNQLIVEIPNATLTDKVRRPLNMKDIAGTIGAVDPYQIADSTTARFVIQMRANTTKPFVTSEGNTILVVSEKHQMLSSASGPNGMPGAELSKGENQPVEESKVLTTKTLFEFLDKNNKFYGKRISIETVDMPVADALRFIAEEAGINIVLDPSLTGLDKKVNLKMRDVPWDQAFVVILKTNNLGYLRIGDLIRITTQEVISKEEEEALKRYIDNLDRTPMRVKVFEVNFLKASELAPKVEKFLDGGALVSGDNAVVGNPGARMAGKVFPDDRANQLIVLDREENMGVIADVIAQFDQQPPQVLIEGRIIEASDSFTRQIGVNWSASGANVAIGGGLTLRPGINVENGISGGNGSLTLNLGTLDVLGDLQSILSLSEIEGKVRILSSPRIVTLNNEQATITQTTKVPYVESPGSTAPGVVVTPTTNFLDIPLTLAVTPQITADSSVIMNVNITRSFLGAGSTPGNPVVDTRTANTRVMVKNGQTSIIGGVYQNDTRNSETGVPFLKDIPLIGGLFKSRDNSITKQELMIFITPRVIKGPKLVGSFGSIGNSASTGKEEGGSNVK